MSDPDNSSNPLFDLVANSDRTPTALDSHGFTSVVPPLRRASDAAAYAPEADEPIRLGARQPSYSSLRSEHIVRKGGTELRTANDPVLVLDSHSVDDDLPIPLSVRQSSIPSFRRAIFTPSHQEKTEEEDHDPQIILMKRLQVQNAQRWKDIGYEPPEGLLPLVRAASQGNLQSRNAARSPAPERFRPPSLTPVQEEEPEVKPPFPSGFRFEELPDFLTGEPVRRLLSSGNLDSIAKSEWNRARSMLRDLQEECTTRIWVEESSYVNELLNLINRTDRPSKPLGFYRSSPDEDLEKLRQKRERLVNDEKNAIESRYTHLTDVLAVLDDRYRQDASELDSRFQNPNFLRRFGKPSREILDARCVAQRLLKQNRIREAEKQAAIVAQMEEEASMRVNELVQERYHAEDQKLKEEYATRREIVILKEKTLVEEDQKAFRIKIQGVDNAIAKIQGQFKEKLAVERPPSVISSRRKEASGRQSALVDRTDEASSVRLPLSPPHLIDRAGDLDVLTRMTEVKLDLESPKRVKTKRADRRAVRKGN
jgi:hypothetical protein